jgi:cellulose synthase/poly-beta-1,6-N-acetylglucosamine synthase-like glycosyltransferase
VKETGAARPSVDVVVPFAGSDAELEAVARAVGGLNRRDGDSAVVVDNRPSPLSPRDLEGVRVVPAPERQSSYYARNRGAAAGENDWLLFIDADVTPPPDLIDRYFERPPGERAGLLAGGIVDAETGPPTAVSRYLTESSSMSQDNTLRGDWPYAQTANCAVRRAALEEVGGFNDAIRSGGDADLCFRLRAAGWELETRDEAAVDHHARSTLYSMVRQRARHGSGAAWLNRAYPGSFPPERWPGLLKWTVIELGRAAGRLVRGDRRDAARAAVAQASAWALQLGRLLPNHVPSERR